MFFRQRSKGSQKGRIDRKQPKAKCLVCSCSGLKKKEDENRNRAGRVTIAAAGSWGLLLLQRLGRCGARNWSSEEGEGSTRQAGRGHQRQLGSKGEVWQASSTPEPPPSLLPMSHQSFPPEPVPKTEWEVLVEQRPQARGRHEAWSPKSRRPCFSAGKAQATRHNNNKGKGKGQAKEWEGSKGRDRKVCVLHVGKCMV